ncbi:hypothetical protein HG558_02255 [Helicobacter pylori]|uniref:hypothetical protein n=1 Tax=Helicobacter pylori TaxID=210 RepID=UPI00192483B5|nr:hypothetical protein [Helicobacter pylori]QQW95934.1 hypothetical protein HG558_02255 [Helicobacter pylori]
MRVVEFGVSGILEAFDYRGVLIHKQEIQANQNADAQKHFLFKKGCINHKEM